MQQIKQLLIHIKGVQGFSPPGPAYKACTGLSGRTGFEIFFRGSIQQA